MNNIVEPIILIDYPKDGWCHLVSNSILNLHQFANNINLKLCWYQNTRGKNRPHYDVKGEYIQKAINAGAKQVNSKEIILFLKQHYSTK